MTLALLFPGQGAQHPDMLRWLDGAAAARPVLRQLAEWIGSDWRPRLADAEWAGGNRVAQCLLVGIGLAAWGAVQAAGLPNPTLVAGYGIGEVAAWSAAGVYDAGAALGLAAARADAMDRSAADTGLVVVERASAALLDKARSRWPFEIATRLAPDRCVVGGRTIALVELEKWLIAQGADARRLPAQAAAHTSHMQQAARRFADVLASQPWQPPRAQVVTNRDGSAVRHVADLKRCLAEQTDHTIQWQRSMQAIAERRPSCVLEIGPGTCLSRLWLAAHPQIPARSIDEFGSAAGAAAWAAEHA